MQSGRHRMAQPPCIAAGWTLERLSPSSQLFGANGIRTGPDGRLYVAQLVGSQISALDVETGELETISPLGGDIVGPDDLAFDARGNLYVTEFMDARVSVRAIDGRTTVLRDDVPGANGITFHQGRLFIDECRIGGRLLELDLDGRAPRILLENLQLPNALAPGPDGLLYFPLVAAGEIWRVHPNGGPAERVVAGLHHPVAVKFDSKGYIVAPQCETGELLRIDVQNGQRTVLATLDPGLDNLTFIQDRLFVSHLTDGRITEILAGGASREVVPAGLQFPLDLAIGDDGTLFVADSRALYAVSPGENLRCVGRMFDPGFPDSSCGLAAVAGGDLVVTTIEGKVVLYRPCAEKHEVLASGLDQPCGVAVTPPGAIVVAERGTGRLLSIDSPEKISVLASGLRNPSGVAIAPDGTYLVSEEGAGRVVKVTGSGIETVLDGLQQPQGIVMRELSLYVVDVGAHALIAFDMEHRTRRTIAANLPVGAPLGVVPKPLRGAPPFFGPFGPFAGIAAAADGALYFSADTEGSVMALRRTKHIDAAEFRG
jgi:sugar lactone lactonase YvrE